MPLTAASRVVAGEKQLRPLAEVLAGEIALLTGLKLEVTDGTSRAGDIVLRIDGKIQAGEPILSLRKRQPTRTTEGAHAITIDQQAVVTGFDYRATAEGTSTILQLLGRAGGAFRLPKLTIKDWPHADYCGVLLDVARQDHPIDAIKKVVQLCRLYKARYLQLHLTDDQGWTFPSTRFPRLGSKNRAAHGGVVPRVYRLAELKELLAYADAWIKGAATLKLPEGDCSVHAMTRGFPLTLVASRGKTRFAGLITGDGPVRIEAPGDHQPFEISGAQVNSYRGITTLARGVLRLNKPGNGPGGGSGTLTVRSLTVGGVKKPAGEYTAATEKWIEGKGKVVVRP
jgi:hypothetical protein